MWPGTCSAVRMNGGQSRKRRHRLSILKRGGKRLLFSKIPKFLAPPRPLSEARLHGSSLPICIMGIAFLSH